jgi:hypothetical protein
MGQNFEFLVKTFFLQKISKSFSILSYLTGSLRNFDQKQQKFTFFEEKNFWPKILNFGS